MITQLVNKERKENPHIIFPFGKVNKKEMNDALKKYNYNFPKELLEFWLEFGGGDLFENETILSPTPVKEDWKDDMDTTNRFYYESGLDTKYIVFQINAAQLAAFDRETNEVILISTLDFRVRNKFKNFNQWFDYLWTANI